MQKKYVVRLTESERDLLNSLVKKPRVSAQKVLRARVLLKTDADGPHWTDAAVANAFDCRTKTIENIRERFVTEGFEITLNGQPKHRARGKILDGHQEARIIALRLGPPPPGFANWTLRLLAEQAVTLDMVETVSHETLRRTLKKTRIANLTGGSNLVSRLDRGGKEGYHGQDDTSATTDANAGLNVPESALSGVWGAALGCL